MRRFYLLIFSISFLSSCILWKLFHYSATTAVYHMAITSAAHVLLMVGTFVLFIAIRNFRWFSAAIHTIYASYLFGLILLYLLIFSSNYFWKKTITFSVLKNYFLKLENFIDALPVQPWIFYLAIALILLFTALLYYLFMPDPSRFPLRYQSLTVRTNRQRIMIISGLLIIALFLFRAPFLRAKQIMHFAEEPLLQFFLGAMWGQGNEVAFEKDRYLLGENDNACLDTLALRTDTAGHSIVVILIDALRSDHLPMYGYHRNTTPFLDSLYRTRDLLVVKDAFSPSTGTVGGIAGLFYSRDWTEFGYNGLNLMKYLKRANYSTYSFLTGYHRDWFGLSALYRSSSDYYYESPKDPSVPPDDDLVTLTQFEKTPLPRRSFTYIHLLSTHTIGKKDPLFRRFLPDKIGLNTDQKTALENNYDNGILQADFVIRKIFQKLSRENILPDCTIYILADHGELFGEDGRWSHGGSVHPKLIQIPLLIYDSQKEWYNNLQTATLKDLAPTIADRLQNPIPGCWEGTSLHQPPRDLTLEINTVTESDFPYGLLQKTDGTIQLQILNKQKQRHSTLVLQNGTWKETTLY